MRKAPGTLCRRARSVPAEPRRPCGAGPGGVCPQVWWRGEWVGLIGGLHRGGSSLGRESREEKGISSSGTYQCRSLEAWKTVAPKRQEYVPSCKDEVPSTPPHEGSVTCLCWGSPEAVWREAQTSFHKTVSRFLLFILRDWHSYEGPAKKSLRTPVESRNKDQNTIHQVRPCDEEEGHVIWDQMSLIQISAAALTLDKSFYSLEPQFFIWKWE